jgi:hypothetical protein
MKSFFPKFLHQKRTEASAPRIRLSLARFRHLLRKYGQAIALCADAADKESGQYIFDNAYIMALVDRAFEMIEGMSYDLHALTGQQNADLCEVVEAIRCRTAELVKAGSAPSQAAGNEEEPEYRLLRNVREILGRPDYPKASFQGDSTSTTLFGVVQSIERAAGDWIVELTRSLGFPRPMTTSVVDLVSGLAASSRSFPLAESSSAGSVPTREFLTSFFSPAFWKDGAPGSAGPQSAGLVAYQLEESMNSVIFHSGGYDLFDVYLSCAPEANYIYCRFPPGPEISFAEGILTRLGFFVSSAGRELTGWIASQPLTETIAKLKMVAKMAAWLLRPPAIAVMPTEEDLARFLGMHD